MSHDIRTPLTALRGALGLLERKDVSPRVTDQMLAMMRRASSRFERLAFGLIAIDMIDEGSLVVLREVWDLRHVVEDALAATKREHDLITVDLPNEPLEVVCDRDRTLQALDHLLDNARKFGGPAGTISVSVERHAATGVVSVGDEGPGVDPSVGDRIFERYVQLGERLPNEPRGAGIGLYLARWSATAMNGSVELVPSDAGATFRLSLPLLPPEI